MDWLQLVSILQFSKKDKYYNMVKQENNNDRNPLKSNKIHKTLRDKLRKKREQLKQHKKQKTERKKQYNYQEQKSKFFNQSQAKQQNLRDLKMKKIAKHIQKFIDIYQDNLYDFYDMFKTFDQGGQIDISGLQNKALHKCLKKLFKYLPLKKQNGQYKKVQTSKINLQRLIKQKVSQSMEYYLENGSRKGVSDNQSSVQENAGKNHKKSKKHTTKNQIVEDNEQVQSIRLYKKQILQNKPTVLGPCISFQDREQLAEQFQRQLLELKKAKQQKSQKQEDQFDFIFSQGKTRIQIKAKQIKKDNQGVPEHLMAVGSALIGQKMEINQQEIQEYNKLHRPKKLVEIHKQLHREVVQTNSKGKRPFNRQKEVLGEGKAGLMSNSMFFDFKNKMSKPSSTNQFL